MSRYLFPFYSTSCFKENSKVITKFLAILFHEHHKTYAEENSVSHSFAYEGLLLLSVVLNV